MLGSFAVTGYAVPFQQLRMAANDEGWVLVLAQHAHVCVHPSCSVE